MDRSINVAVVGATGLVGREILAVLAERQFPLGKVRLLASTRSAGQQVDFAGEQHRVEIAHEGAFVGMDVVLMSAGSTTSRALAPAAVQAGAYVIDNSSAFRMHVEAPLVVPEVNAAVLRQTQGPCIVANPNCSTIQMVAALAPLHREATLRRIVASTYQAVSGRGQAGLEELGSQVNALLGQGEVVNEAFAKRIAFNCLPQIDVLDPDGHSFEETKMVQESRKILAAPTLSVVATCVRVPVFNGHGVSLVATFERPLERGRALELLRGAPGILLVDDPQQNLYPTSLEAEGQDATLVGRVRACPSEPNTLALWCVADNLRKGAATNAVQIAELLAQNGAFAGPVPA